MNEKPLLLQRLLHIFKVRLDTILLQTVATPFPFNILYQERTSLFFVEIYYTTIMKLQ